MTIQNQLQSGFGLYFLTVTVCVLISFWSVFADPIINNDGTLYIQAAQALNQGDIDSALTFHKWPFYSALIAIIQAVTGFTYEISAHTLNALFSALTGVIFILIIKQLGGSAITLAIAALVIVFYPGLNEIRSYIVRDHGYIAFYLCALLFLLKALDLRSNRYLIVSILFMAVALLFRIEGSVFLIAIPCIYLLSRTHKLPLSQPIVLFLIGVASIILISIFGWWLYSPVKDSNISLFSIDNIQNGWQQATHYLDAKIEILKYQVIDTSSNSTGQMVFIWTVMGIIVTQVIFILSIPFSVLAGYAIYHHVCFPHSQSLKPWKLFIYFNLGILFIFTLTKLFLTDRYPLALTVTLLLAVPFALEKIYSRWQAKTVKNFKSSIGYLLLCLVLLANSIDGMTSYSKKHYLKQAGEWLSNNIDEQSKLYSNNRIVGFYSGLANQNITIAQNNNQLIGAFYRGEWILFDYLAIKVNPDPEFEAHLKKTLWVEPVKVFKNKHDREIRIYDIKTYRSRKPD